MGFVLKSAVVFFLTLLPQIARADMNFVDWLLFSDKAYAKDMEVHAYIIPQEQLCSALDNLSQEIIQPDNKALFNKNTFLLLKVRNNGPKHAWGMLACKVPTYHIPIKLSIYGVGRSDKSAYNTYLIQLGSLILGPNEAGTPKISVEWDKLYTK